MKILILAAGYGTRLYPLIRDTPKSLLPIEGKPLINFTLDKVQNLNGWDEILVVTNNKFTNHFQEWARKQTPCPDKIRVVNDGTNSPEERLGSVGDIEFVLKNEKFKDDLLVIGGDNLFDYELNDCLSFAHKKSPATTIGVFDIDNIEEAKKFGVVTLNREQKVMAFEEKPPSPKSSLIAMCFYYFPKESLKYVTQYIKLFKKADKAGDYIQWLSQQTDVYGFQFKGKWYDIGSIESYQEAQKDFGAKK